MNGDVPPDGVVADVVLGAQPEIGDRVSSN